MNKLESFDNNKIKCKGCGKYFEKIVCSEPSVLTLDSICNHSEPVLTLDSMCSLCRNKKLEEFNAALKAILDKQKPRGKIKISTNLNVEKNKGS